MNCHHVQRLLAGGEANRPPPEFAEHLAGCPACRDYQRRLTRLDRTVKLLPVPATQAKARLLERLASAPGPSRPQPVARGKTVLATNKERALQKLSVAFALAAALVLIAVGLWAWQQDSPAPVVAKKPATDPLVARLMQRDLRLASARTPRERIETLADLADDLHEGTRALARTARPEDLAALVGMYRRVVGKGIVAHARHVPGAERRGVLEPVASQLLRAGHDLELLAADLPAASAASLRDMAAAAHDGDRQLRSLLEERS